MRAWSCSAARARLARRGTGSFTEEATHTGSLSMVARAEGACPPASGLLVPAWPFWLLPPSPCNARRCGAGAGPGLGAAKAGTFQAALTQTSSLWLWGRCWPHFRGAPPAAGEPPPRPSPGPVRLAGFVLPAAVSSGQAPLGFPPGARQGLARPAPPPPLLLLAPLACSIYCASLG